MIVVAGHFTVPADKQRAFADAAKELTAETLQEDGCLFYEFWADLDGSGRFSVLEAWETEEHLDAHLRTPHLAAFRAKRAEIGMQDESINRYVVSEVKPI